MLHVSHETEQFPGPQIDFDCPACGILGIEGTTYDQRRREWLYGLIPLNDIKTSWIVCSNCGHQLRSRVTAAELAELEHDQLAGVLYADPGAIRKAMAVISALVAIFPIVGTVFAGIVVAANWKIRAWPRTLAIISLVASIGVWVLFFLVAILLAGLGVLD